MKLVTSVIWLWSFLISNRLKWSILNQSQEIKVKMRSFKTKYQALRQIIPFYTKFTKTTFYYTFRTDFIKKIVFDWKLKLTGISKWLYLIIILKKYSLLWKFTILRPYKVLLCIMPVINRKEKKFLNYSKCTSFLIFCSDPEKLSLVIVFLFNYFTW